MKTKWKQVWIEHIVKKIRPETKWSNYEQTNKGRTCVCCNMLRWFVIRGERPSKLRDSWFSAKFMEVKYNKKFIKGKALNKCGGFNRSYQI